MATSTRTDRTDAALKALAELNAPDPAMEMLARVLVCLGAGVSLALVVAVFWLLTTSTWRPW